MEETSIERHLDTIRVLQIGVEEDASAYDIGLILKSIEELYAIVMLHNRNIIIPFEKEDYNFNRKLVTADLIESMNLGDDDPLYKLLKEEITINKYIDDIPDEFSKKRAYRMLSLIRYRINSELIKIYRTPIDIEVIKKGAKPISRMGIKEVLQITPLIFPNYAQLSVKFIQFNSPGKIDLLGVGAVFQHVKELVIFMIENYQNKEKRKLDLLLKREELNKRRLENITLVIGAVTKFNLNNDEYNNMRDLIVESLSEFPRELITDIKINEVEKLE